MLINNPIKSLETFYGHSLLWISETHQCFFRHEPFILNVYKLCKFLIQAVQLCLLQFSCTHNALLILTLKYAETHSLLQDTHFRWWICRCPPSHPVHSYTDAPDISLFKCLEWAFTHSTCCILSHLIRPKHNLTQFHATSMQRFSPFCLLLCFFTFVLFYLSSFYTNWSELGWKKRVC